MGPGLATRARWLKGVCFCVKCAYLLVLERLWECVEGRAHPGLQQCRRREWTQDKLMALATVPTCSLPALQRHMVQKWHLPTPPLSEEVPTHPCPTGRCFRLTNESASQIVQTLLKLLPLYQVPGLVRLHTSLKRSILAPHSSHSSQT